MTRVAIAGLATPVARFRHMLVAVHPISAAATATATAASTAAAPVPAAATAGASGGSESCICHHDPGRTALAIGRRDPSPLTGSASFVRA